MSVESDVDRASFLDSDEFGVPVTIGGNTFDGIMDNEYLEVGESIAPIESRRPLVWMRDSDIASVPITTTSTVTIAGIDYFVRSIRPDGTGLSILTLSLTN